MRALLLWGVLVWLIALPHAQAQTPPPFGQDLSNALKAEGRIDNRNPRQVYHLDALKGEVLRARLEALDGDLDPVLSLFDANGSILFANDDYNGTRNVDTTFNVNADGRYYLVVARFGYALGSTQGSYRLTLERVGVVSQQGITLRYDVSVIDTITNTQPQVYYTLRAEAGDIINIDMIRSSGNLDPYLQLVDAERFIIANNDDAPNQTTRNARIEDFLIEQTGVYIVVATRYGQAAGDTVGSFVLTVSKSQNSGIGNSRRAPAPLAYNQSIEGTLNSQFYERYYRFTGEENDVITLTLDQVSGRFDAYLVLADSNLNSLVEDDDSGGGRNARIGKYRLPASGDYYVIAMRFGGATGEGQGSYRLQLRFEGNAFANVDASIPRLLYGTTVEDVISEADPSSLYAFWGTEGEVVTLTMSRADGNLLPVLELLDSQQRRLLRAGDSNSGSFVSIDRYTLPYTGAYYINAKRYDGSLANASSVGKFLMTLVLMAQP
jgi:hypothetical protein